MKRKRIGFILFLNIVLLLGQAGWVMAGSQGEPACMEANSILSSGKCAPPIETDGEDGPYGQKGPAPFSGDGVSDGSGFDHPSDPNGLEKGNSNGGPAPNSGDGIPDGRE